MEENSNSQNLIKPLIFKITRLKIKSYEPSAKKEVYWNNGSYRSNGKEIRLWKFGYQMIKELSFGILIFRMNSVCSQNWKAKQIKQYMKMLQWFYRKYSECLELEKIIRL